MAERLAHDHLTHEREITSPVDLCLPDGRLNPEAVGWTRRPLHRANLRGWGRNKRFEYWCVTAPTHAVAVNVSHADYRVTYAAFFLDFATGHEIQIAERRVLPMGPPMPMVSGEGGIRAQGRRIALGIDETPFGTRLRARSERLSVDVLVDRPEGHESLGVVVPWNDQLFQYTRKDNCLPAQGRVVADGQVYEFDPATAYATLDHGRGRWPYSIVWNWGAASGRCHGREIGLQIGGKWTVGTGMTENVIRVDGRLHKIGHELTWYYDTHDWLAPWRIVGRRIDLTFTPFHDRAAHSSWLVVESVEHQVFGYYSGHVVTDEGERIPVDGLLGWAEEVRRRW